MRKSLGGAESLVLNTQFKKLYQKGKSSVHPSLVVYTKRNGLNRNRFGITVSKKLGKAVVRNRAKRRLREVFRLTSQHLAQGYDFVMVARGRTASCPYNRLSADFNQAVKALGVLKDEKDN